MTNNTSTGALVNSTVCAETIAQQLKELGLNAETGCDYVTVTTPSHPEIKVYVHFSLRRKDAHVGVQRKKGFALTEAGLKNPKAVADRIVEKVENEASHRQYANERQLREQALKAKLVEAGFEIDDDYSYELRCKRHNGVIIKGEFDARGVDLHTRIPADKLHLLKEFLDKLAE